MTYANTTRKPENYRIPARFTPVVFSFYMAFLMSLAMCFVIVAVTGGISGNYVARVLSVWKIAMPTAFVVVLLVRPLVLRLVAWTVRHV